MSYMHVDILLVRFYNLHILIYKTRSKSHISDIFLLPQIHFDGIEIEEVDNVGCLLVLLFFFQTNLLF
jgi:hypothetical protein